jgi:anti-sigma-K factor RskA
MSSEFSHREKFEELCSGYVLNALNKDERQAFEEMLKEASEEEIQLFRELRATANQLAFAAEEQEPSENVEQRIMNEIRSQSDDSFPKSLSDTDNKGHSGFRWKAFAAAASFAILILMALYTFNLSSEVNEQEQTINEQQSKIVELESELEQKEELLSILKAREVDLVTMAGLEVNPKGYGKIIWDSQKQQALLQVSNLPPVPQDKSYQLWIIKNNKPISAGVFAVDDSSDSFFKIEELAESDPQSTNAFAITMEPRGGVPQPTGDMYLMGDIR